MRGVEEKAHKDTTKGASNGDGGNPRQHQETDSLEVDGLESTVAKTDTDGGTSDAHGGRDGKRVLGEDEDSDGSAHLHRAASAGGVVGDLVTHDYWRR